MPDCYIYDAVRTPRGKGKNTGGLADISPIHLARTALQAIERRNHLDTGVVDDVVFGCVEPTGEQGANIARLAVLHAGWHQTVPGVTINRFCASGLEATNMAAAQVMAGQAKVTVSGGVESMSRVPMGSTGGPWASDPALAINSYFVPQGISADLIATRWNYSRRDVDGYAAESQRRAAEAWELGWFERSIVPVRDENGVIHLQRDEHPREGTTIESLAQLKPSFHKLGRQFGFDAVALQRYPDVEQIEHVHTAGNSSGIVDGAAAVLLGNEDMGAHLGRARARIRSFASIGSEPCIMLTGPADSARIALERAGMEPGDIDLWEVNEAFAAVVLRFMEEMNVDHDTVNVAGGAIALGHPLGATGAMILGTVLDELERRELSTALITLCVGAGMGTATIIERV